MTRVFLLGLLALALFLNLTSCADKAPEKNKAIKIRLSKDVKATVEVSDGQGRPVADDTLVSLFDNNPATWWTSAAKNCEKVFFSIYADKPVYLKRVTLVNHGKTHPVAGGVILGCSRTADGDGIGGEETEGKFIQNDAQVLDVSTDPYFQMLKGKSIGFWIKGCASGKGKFEISEIRFEFSRESNFTPEFNFGKLKSLIESVAEHKGVGGWHFKDDYKEPNKRKYLAHLMYYGLRGDKEAEKLFNNYAPSGAELSEDFSDLQSWYYELKPH